MISELMNSMVESFQQMKVDKNLPIKTIEEHAGKFTWDEFRARGFNAPAIFITNLGWRQMGDKEPRDIHDMCSPFFARFAIAVITQNAKSDDLRNQLARDLCIYICSHLESNDFGIDSVSEAKNIRVDPRFMNVVSKDGQSLWIVDWWHQLLMIPEALPELDDLNGIDAEHLDAFEPNDVRAAANYDVGD